MWCVLEKEDGFGSCLSCFLLKHIPPKRQWHFTFLYLKEGIGGEKKEMKKGKAQKLFRSERAVSPVIGVILMVAITIILAGIISIFLMGVIPSQLEEPKMVQIHATRISDTEVNFLIVSITPVGTNMTALAGTGGIDITEADKLEVGDTFNNEEGVDIPVGTQVVLTATFDDGVTQVVFTSKI